MAHLHMFDDSVLRSPPEGVARLLEEVRQQQARLLGHKQAYPGIYSTLERAGRVRALLIACRAGNMESRAAEICARNSPPINDIERAMAGYRDALFEVQMGHPAPELCRRDLLRLHQLILARTRPEQAGRCREEAAGALEAWESAAQRCLEGAAPLLLSGPCLLAGFLLIQPFDPGGERMGFLLTRLLLQKAGAALPVSWEELACRHRTFLVEALGAAEEGDFWPFIECFLMLLYLGGGRAEKAFALLPGRKMTKKNRVEALVATSPVPISKGEICALLPDVSPTTVEAALGELVKSGRVLRTGPARTARYALGI